MLGRLFGLISDVAHKKRMRGIRYCQVSVQFINMDTGEVYQHHMGLFAPKYDTFLKLGTPEKAIVRFLEKHVGAKRIASQIRNELQFLLGHAADCLPIESIPSHLIIIATFLVHQRGWGLLVSTQSCLCCRIVLLVPHSLLIHWASNACGPTVTTRRETQNRFWLCSPRPWYIARDTSRSFSPCDCTTQPRLSWHTCLEVLPLLAFSLFTAFHGAKCQMPHHGGNFPWLVCWGVVVL